jgi:hypothetical protein
MNWPATMLSRRPVSHPAALERAHAEEELALALAESDREWVSQLRGAIAALAEGTVGV